MALLYSIVSKIDRDYDEDDMKIHLRDKILKYAGAGLQTDGNTKKNPPQTLKNHQDVPNQRSNVAPHITHKQEIGNHHLER